MPSVLIRLNELKKIYREQNFNFTKEQQEAYNVLLSRRREDVSGFYRDGKVWTGSSVPGKIIEESV
tara:strand:+ start:4577 stop:4774 length:198 start_codon:yes stop_codon:yes gene_type:complete